MTGYFISVGYLKNLMNVPLCLIMFVSYFLTLSNIVKMEKNNLIQQMLDMKNVRYEKETSGYRKNGNLKMRLLSQINLENL